MFEHFMPDLDFGSVFEISGELLKRIGVEGVIFDVDNTLVHHTVSLPDERLKAFAAGLAGRGIKLALVSNNSRERAEKFGLELGAPAFGKAGKPKKNALAAPMRSLGTAPEKTVFVGDQLLTDCLCAKRNGLRFFLVEPIDPWENPFFLIKRLIEKPLLKIYKAKKKK